MRKIICFMVLIIFINSICAITVPTQTQDEEMSELQYFNLINNVFNLTEEELSLLNQNDFVVINRQGTDDILDAYCYYWENDLPIFITTDTMLQMWHLIFDTMLEKTEEEIFYPILKNLSFNMADTYYNKIMVHDMDESSKDTLIFLSVATKLADPTYSFPEVIEPEAAQIYSAILDELSIFDAVDEFQSINCRFIDDFSQYKPRDHYTHSESLERYFRLYKWFSRIPFFFDEYMAKDYYLHTSPESMINSAIDLVWTMKNTKMEIGGINSTGIEIWKVFKEFLNGIVGETYTIDPLDIDFVCSSVFGKQNWDCNDITSNEIEDIQTQILKKRSIPEPHDPFIIDALAYFYYQDILPEPQSPKTFVLFGERLTLDTYTMNHLVDPYVDERFLPIGLDFAATCLNSDRAEDLVANNGYFSHIKTMQEAIQHWPSVEKQTLYWKWIESLGELVVKKPLLDDTREPMIPPFMQMGPWLDEKLTTVMGSWAQLKHDMILYAKQGITSDTICSTPEGYVEPYPSFYKKLKDIIDLYLTSGENLIDIGINVTANYRYYVFKYFSECLETLESIAEKELLNIPLNQTEREFIRNTYSEERCESGGPFFEGWLPLIAIYLNRDWWRPADWPNSRGSLIADIYTDLNFGEVLEVATGLFEHLIVKVPGWFNDSIVTVGPVFSYFEFVTPIDKRMTDEEWRGILEARVEDKYNDSDYSIFPRGFWAQSYMTSLEMTSSIIYRDKDDFIAPEWFQSRSYSDLYNPYFDYEMVSYDYECTDFTILTSWIEESSSSSQESSSEVFSSGSCQHPTSKYYPSKSIQDSTAFHDASTSFSSIFVIIPALLG
ncbi:MAG: DUF3160 domain-containing protein, partial [Candidatus Thorarchaeota archaeon]